MNYSKWQKVYNKQKNNFFYKYGFIFILWYEHYHISHHSMKINRVFIEKNLIILYLLIIRFMMILTVMLLNNEGDKVKGWKIYVFLSMQITATKKHFCHIAGSESIKLNGNWSSQYIFQLLSYSREWTLCIAQVNTETKKKQRQGNAGFTTCQFTNSELNK